MYVVIHKLHMIIKTYLYMHICKQIFFRDYSCNYIIKLGTISSIIVSLNLLNQMPATDKDGL